jgi:hypothetical protein
MHMHVDKHHVSMQAETHVPTLGFVLGCPVGLSRLHVPSRMLLHTYMHAFSLHSRLQRNVFFLAMRQTSMVMAW